MVATRHTKQLISDLEQELAVLDAQLTQIDALDGDTGPTLEKAGPLLIDFSKFYYLFDR
jgi:capsule polysaccharide export protein KpsE/RkpR